MAFRYDRRALKRIIAARALDEVELARAAGLSDRTVYYIARGVTDPKASTLAKLASVLGVSVEDFFVRKDKAAA